MLTLYWKLPFPPVHVGRAVHVSVSQMTNVYDTSTELANANPGFFYHLVCLHFILLLPIFCRSVKTLDCNELKKISVYSKYICATRATQLYVF